MGLAKESQERVNLVDKMNLTPTIDSICLKAEETGCIKVLKQLIKHCEE